MDHPDISRIRRTGYAQSEPKVLRADAFGRPIFLDDELLCIDDIEFLADELSTDAREVLTMTGATYRNAEK